MEDRDNQLNKISDISNKLSVFIPEGLEIFKDQKLIHGLYPTKETVTFCKDGYFFSEKSEFIDTLLEYFLAIYEYRKTCLIS